MTMIEQLQTWYVITTKENLAIKAHVIAPWSNTPDAHVTTFARQLERRQVECKDHGVAITEDGKVDHFVSQMYACGMFKANLLDYWEESSNKLWGATMPQFTNQYARERRKLEREQAHKNFESSAAFQ